MNYPDDADAPIKVPAVSTSAGRTMRFSSPMPWIVAVVPSLTIWGMIGWMIWRLLRP